MIKSAHTGKIVQEGTLMPFDEEAESGFIAQAHARHEGEIVRFRLNGFGHEAPLLDQQRQKEKAFEK